MSNVLENARLKLSRNCKHSERFYCMSVSAMQTNASTHYVFSCSQCNAYWLNFDPVFAGSNPAFDWRDAGIVFAPLETVSPNFMA